MNRYKLVARLHDHVLAEATFSGAHEDCVSIQKFFGLANWGGLVTLDIEEVCEAPDAAGEFYHVKGRGE